MDVKNGIKHLMIQMATQITTLNMYVDRDLDQKKISSQKQNPNKLPFTCTSIIITNIFPGRLGFSSFTLLQEGSSKTKE